MKHNTLTILLALLPALAGAQTVLDDDLPEDDRITVETPDGEEEEMDFPEAMTFDLDSLLGEYMAKSYLDAAGSDCRQRDENPEYPKQTYIDRLSRMPTTMEMAYNSVVQTFIDRYAGRLRHSVSYMLGAANFYVPIFEEALEAYQMPLELKYLPVIESALNPRAVSRAGATGLWQFMITTGKEYGLEVNSLVDERRDPLKASYAAAHYLRDLYRIFGDWNLVIAAYNCGPANVTKAIHRAGGENKDYWHIYPFLPKETRGYVPAFIAANYIMNYYCDHNICPMTSRLPAKTDTVMTDRLINLAQVAAVMNLDLEMLQAVNPQYRKDVVPGNQKPCPLRLPTGEVGRFIDLQDSIARYNASELLSKRLEVAPNDDAPTFVSKRSARRTSRTARGKSVTVRRGDNLGAIAKRNGTTVARLRSLNGIRGNNIRAGQKLRVR